MSVGQKIYMDEWEKINKKEEERKIEFLRFLFFFFSFFKELKGGKNWNYSFPSLSLSLCFSYAFLSLLAGTVRGLLRLSRSVRFLYHFWTRNNCVRAWRWVFKRPWLNFLSSFSSFFLFIYLYIFSLIVILHFFVFLFSPTLFL